MKVKFKKWVMGINTKLVLRYAILFITGNLIAFSLIYCLTKDYLRAQTIETLFQAQAGRIVAIANNLEQYETLISTLADDQKLRNFIDNSYLSGSQEYAAYQDYVYPIVSSLLSAQPFGIAIELLRNDVNSWERIMENFENVLKRIPGGNILKDNRSVLLVMNKKRLSSESWFSNTASYERLVWQQISKDKAYDNLSVCTRVGDVKNPNTGGAIRVTIPLHVLFQNAADKGTAAYTDIIYSADGSLLYASDDITEQEAEEARTLLLGGNKLVNGNNVFIQSRISDEFTVISVQPLTLFHAYSKQLMLMLVLILTLITAVLIALILIVTNAFTKRILHITHAIQRFKEDSMNVHIADKGRDEIAYMASAFNDMATRIHVLIEENYKVSLSKKEIQLKTLQTQINPHMLYNSLSTISRLANKNDVANINKMVRALTTFYRMSLNKGGDYISVRDEFSHIYAYLDIHQIRNGDKFVASFDIDDMVYDYDTINVLLQPFVENIFEHGIDGRDEPVHIQISAKIEDDLIIYQINDDGAGFDMSKPIDTAQSKFGGYGVKNVDERIKLHFGEQYGVTIDSEPCVGTKVVIKTPLFRRSNRKGGSQC